MPLLRITCLSHDTEQLVARLTDDARASEVTVVSGVGRPEGTDLIFADVPRSSIDSLLERLPERESAEGLRVSVEPSERLFPVSADSEADHEAVVWAQVDQDMSEVGRLSLINVLLVVIAAMIAAVGIKEDQLLLIVGAMALSPDYFPIADTCLSVVRRDWHRMRRGLRTLSVCYAAGVLSAFALTEVLSTFDIISAGDSPSRQLILFISEPDALSVVVAVLAGIAGLSPSRFPMRAASSECSSP
ncbi:MAG: DUF389 domain-containing protein [Acidimicrobiia bacterium]|nr:DUF389 domain-containing protein [Acidimicrobiia bacterium]